MKKITGLLAVTVLLLTGCDRDMEFETLSVTEPALEVLVEGQPSNGQYPKIDGATVTLLTSTGQELATATTDGSGKAIFTKAQLKEKGTFTVRVEKSGYGQGQVDTPLILLNDGITLVIITLLSTDT